jgi:hypothetical protein
VTFELAHGNGPELLIPKAFEQPPGLVGQERREGGRGLSIQELFDERFGSPAWARQLGEAQHVPAAPLLPPLVAAEIERLARRDGNQQPPQLVAIGQLREPSLSGIVAKVGERTEGDIFFVRGAAPRGAFYAPARPADGNSVPP